MPEEVLLSGSLGWSRATAPSLVAGWGGVGCGWPHEYPVAPSTPAPLPGWRAGPEPTQDSKFGATAPLKSFRALDLTVVDAVVLKLDVLNGEGGIKAGLILFDVPLFHVQWLEIRVLILFPEPGHVA